MCDSHRHLLASFVVHFRTVSIVVLRTLKLFHKAKALYVELAYILVSELPSDPAEVSTLREGLLWRILIAGPANRST